jgi:site-specific DNA-methyltransferase (cytosine-N4-specific)
MKSLLRTKKYNGGKRPSQHDISPTAFLTNNGGSIPPSCLTQEALAHFGSLMISSNTASTSDPYLAWCKANGAEPHPARMQPALARFFISFLTEAGDMVFDPFGGSNTTGATAQALNRKWAVVEAQKSYQRPSQARFCDRRLRS